MRGAAGAAAALAAALTSAQDQACSPWPPQKCTIDEQVGCFDDHSRIIGDPIAGDARMSYEFCAGTCRTLGFGAGSYYGVEDGNQCMCGKKMKPANPPARPDKECNTACQGDPSKKCGDSYRINIFKATCTNETLSSRLHACIARCSDAGHCCVGTTSAYKHPSCVQGCIAADRESRANPIATQAESSCKNMCTHNDNKCAWDQAGSAFKDMNNCGHCPDKPKSAGGGQCGNDGVGGRECSEGCEYYFDPAAPVCGMAHSDHSCGDLSRSTAGQCEKNTCNDWESCTIYCQKQGSNGCCTFDKDKQCTFVKGGAAPSMKVQGSKASYCAPFSPAFGGGGGGGITGGGVFLILFFVGGFTYFAAGFAFNYRKRDLRGAEAIPNKDFWVDVPHLIKDGMVYARLKSQDAAERLRGRYTTI